MTLRLLGGLDPTLGAGIARDLSTALTLAPGLELRRAETSKTGSEHGVTTRDVLVAAITATTAQGDGLAPRTLAVYPNVVERALLGGVNEPALDRAGEGSAAPPDVTKIGLVPDSLGPAIQGALQSLREIERRCGHVLQRIVVDPVLGASAGGDLGVSAAGLLPWLDLADLVTPNQHEAVVLLDALRRAAASHVEGTRDPSPRVDPVDAHGLAVSLAEALSSTPRRRRVWVLLKGGHAEDTDRVRDVLASAAGVVAVFERPKQRGPEIRGTGCALATAIATRWHAGGSLIDAVGDAIVWLDEVRRHATPAPSVPLALRALLDAIAASSTLDVVRGATQRHPASLHLPVDVDVLTRVVHVLRDAIAEILTTPA
jgi:hydroxymethylpyrimidine/phosphomethylpyrimidine kinase